MWNPARFLRNLCALSFVAVFLFLTMQSLLGSLTALALLLFGPVGLAAAREGVRFADIHNCRPRNAHLWHVSRAMAECYLTFCVIISGLIAIANADFRFWLATSSLIGLFALYAVTTSIAFVVIRWSYGVGVSMTLEKHDNKAG